MSAVRWTRGDAALGREVEAVLLAAAAAGPAVETLRDNPRRRILLVRGPSGAVIVKQFRAGSGRHALRERWKARLGAAPAEREWRALAALRARGVRVPDPLALGVLRDGDRLLVLAWIEGVPLADALHAPPAERRALLHRLGASLAALHAAGWSHGDPHAGNALVASGEIVWLDWQHARPDAGATARRRDLAFLEYSLSEHVSRADRMRVRRAALGLAGARGDAARRALRAAGAEADRRAAEHAESRTRRAERPGRLAAVSEIDGTRGLRLRELEPETLAAVIASHRQALAAGDACVSKRDARSCVTALAVAGRRVVVKDAPWRGLARALADVLRGSAGRRAWRAGHGLRARRIGAALPLAFGEVRRLGVPVRSWVVLEDVRPAVEAAFALDTGAEPAAVLDVLARLLVALHRRGVDHGDLKATHVLLRDDLEPVLLDLEGVRFRRRLSDARRLRALAELNASLPDVYPAAERRRAFARYARALPFERGAAHALAHVVRESLARKHRWSGVDCDLARGDAAQPPTPAAPR